VFLFDVHNLKLFGTEAETISTFIVHQKYLLDQLLWQ